MGQYFYQIWPIEYDLTIHDNTTSQSWNIGFTYEHTGYTLDIHKYFNPVSNATWDFLQSAHGYVCFVWNPAVVNLPCYPSRVPSLDVTGAVLLIDGDFPVPSGGSSWGAIKAIYSVSP